jgi:hypothetical protein
MGNSNRGPKKIRPSFQTFIPQILKFRPNLQSFESTRKFFRTKMVLPRRLEYLRVSAS